jgi:putative membrane protein
MWHQGFFPFFPLIWILVIFLLFFLCRNRWSRNAHWHNEKSAEEVLRERFAQGEIEEDDYKKRLDVLRKHAK